MKTLLLMRHAKSSWKDVELADHDRPLKKRGQKDALSIAKVLKKKDLVPGLIMTSSALRSTETANAMLEKLEYKGEISVQDTLYMAEPKTYIEKIQSVPNEVDRLLVVGHNPGLESLVQILGDKIDSMPTGGLAVIVLPIDSWGELNLETEGKLSRLWRPEELKK
jgi:phosphohistidine phosphatase